MPQNTLYLLIGAFLVISVGLAYALYQERQKSPGIELSVGPKGIAIEKK